MNIINKKEMQNKNDEEIEEDDEKFCSDSESKSFKSCDSDLKNADIIENNEESKNEEAFISIDNQVVENIKLHENEIDIINYPVLKHEKVADVIIEQTNKMDDDNFDKSTPQENKIENKIDSHILHNSKTMKDEIIKNFNLKNEDVIAIELESESCIIFDKEESKPINKIKKSDDSMNLSNIKIALELDFMKEETQDLAKKIKDGTENKISDKNIEIKYTKSADSLIKEFVSSSITENLESFSIIFPGGCNSSNNTKNIIHKIYFDHSKFSYLKILQTLNAKVTIKNVDFKNSKTLCEAIKFFPEANTIEFVE